MSIYDINYNTLATQTLPPDKRYTKMVAFVRILLSPLQYLNNLWFVGYRTGTTAPAYAAGTYAKYAQVKYNKIVYESLIAGNTALPTDTTKWKVVQENFIGLFERITYNGQKLVLEYALNKWFGTTFRQPPSVSDIYVSTNTIGTPFFRVGDVETISSSSRNDGSSEFVINSYTVALQYNFTIFVPVAVYNALDPLMANNEAIFRAFANKYIPAGLTYNITTY